MREETKDVLYILAILASSFIFFNIGQRVDNKCAQRIDEQRLHIEEGENKAAAAKLDFCIKNRPSLDDKQQFLEKFDLFKKIHCPQRLLYGDCDKYCREDLIFDIKSDMDYWENYTNNNKEDYLEHPEGYYPEP